ncbi:MAG: DNA topoisomerase [Bacteroidales bacterium]|nr:DNA topoisomerase [Bacteroidales bacterium]
MVVIIAEKPSVARELAHIVGANRREDGFISGNGYCVTWAFGHLVQITAPESDVPWRAENLPVMPPAFLLQPGQTTGADGKKKADDGYVHQLEVIRKLFDECDYIINAGDAGREGELIQRYIYAYVGCTKPVKRLWISSLTDKAIREGLDNLHENSEFDTLYAAGKARSEADWLVGINATRALSIVAGRGVRSLGRVQTPTLAMVCKRYLENRDFVPQTFWNIRITATRDGIEFKAVTKDRFLEKEKVDAAVEKVKELGSLTVTKMEKKDKSLAPPYLHDLTSLQKEANKRYNMSAQDTLDTAQRLYEKKVLTYPRTGSKFVPDDVFATLPSLIRLQNAHPRFGAVASGLEGKPLNRRSVDATKVTDHHALLPTEVLPQGLSDTEQKVYDLVLARLLESVSPKCDMISTSAELVADDIVFSARGNIVVNPGWKAVLNDKADKKKEGEEEEQDLPPFVVGDVTPVTAVECTEGKTKPKPLHTEATLLEAMEHAGKEVEDDDLKSAIKDVGIGTPATRAGEIETILKRGYVTRQGKALVPSSIGLAIYESVKDKYIANVEMTGRWETSLAKIVDGAVSPAAFDESIRRYVQALTSEILSIDDVSLKAAAMAEAEPDAIKCPCCGGPMKVWDNNVKCKVCGHSLWRTVAGKLLSEATMKKLITTGRTQVLKGFKSKPGNEFEAALKLDDDKRIAFDFEKVDEKRKIIDKNKMAKVSIKTPKGEIVVRLYDETPYHRDNFIQLAKQGYYDGTLFHRVIKDFMVQGGDPDSKGAAKGARLGSGGPGYTLPAEINPALFHKRGALAAARLGDEANQERKSSGSQFYIVWGQTYSEGQLGQLARQMEMQAQQTVFNSLAAERREQILDMRRNRDRAGLSALQDELTAMTQAIVKEKGLGKLSPEQKTIYSTVGGTPFLDGQYTVFGEVESGLEVVDAIQNVATDGADRPEEDITMTVTVIQ